MRHNRRRSETRLVEINIGGNEDNGMGAVGNKKNWKDNGWRLRQVNFEQMTQFKLLLLFKTNLVPFQELY